jgi:prolyl 4-hydroxylase
VIIESLFVRAEHLLRIPRLDQRNTEDIQVVHYKDGQKYDSHHDWGVSGYPESRYITLLLYLSDMVSPTAGGETSFPKGADGAGFKIHPGKGSAVLFYNLLEDGNGDDLALHAALPIHQGEKWLANFWVWDPARR